ncbi:hypothetical protein K7Z75_24755 [Mycobacterium avium subsp. hominissuis]|uniref:hypothetical protein n=1 Tax=Mycobacterium avium TaxID=1764 RepID=UPI002939B930|nr:hypothetical protein [Mycobacterium avium]MDV3306838.1 hypothetical protein [Mycobacterium avium subsp. hominissuis]
MSHPGDRIQGTAVASLNEVIDADLDSFLDLISERAFGSDRAYFAVDVQYRIVASTADRLTLDVTAAIDPNSDAYAQDTTHRRADTTTEIR